MREDIFEQNPVLKHSFELAIMIIEYCETLQEQKRFVIGNQLLKSGTSIGANVMEAQNAESRADFIHKMKIAAKEAEESQFWIMLCNKAKSYPPADHLFPKLMEIHKLLGKILSNGKKGMH